MKSRSNRQTDKKKATRLGVGESMANEGKYNLPRVMTVKELSEYLRVHPSTIYKLLRRGELPGFRIGTDWRFNAEVIDKWCLERNMRPADEAMRGNYAYLAHA